ncbi:hypothetical protein [Pseudomonas sp. KCJK8521]|uniref:hypothetical protein n=1 Tax=Pseudomonas sp. KCJK8521 TaxID=3344557 RepID=UPI00390628A9
MKSERDPLASARSEFEKLKLEVDGSGKKLTISAIARLAGVDRKYFYGKINTPDESKRQAWINLGEEINRFRSSQVSLGEIRPEASIAQKLQNALIDNYRLLESVGDLEKSRAKMQDLIFSKDKRLEELQAHVARLESNLLFAKSEKGAVVGFGSKPHIVSPDLLREGTDSLSLKKAWVLALDKLRTELDRPLDKTLYITVGAPGSGKSTWSLNQSHQKNFSIIFDACCMTKVDRYEVLSLGRKYPRTKVVAVVFYVEFSTLRKRNDLRESAKQLPMDKLSSMFESLEYPSLGDASEFFDEIVMVRGEAGLVH